jgi:hypothetical protein
MYISTDSLLVIAHILPLYRCCPQLVLVNNGLVASPRPRKLDGESRPGSYWFFEGRLPIFLEN